MYIYVYIFIVYIYMWDKPGMNGALLSKVRKTKGYSNFPGKHFISKRAFVFFQKAPPFPWSIISFSHFPHF